MNSNENTAPADTHNLARFIEAQQNCYPAVVKELSNGSKQTHWMWFIFPQIDGLGTSSTAKKYAIKSLAEARAFFQHPLLGKRLIECTELMLSVKGKSAREVMGSPDDRKLQSCMTLFASLPETEPVFRQVLDQYYGGRQDAATLQILEQK